MRRHHFGYLAGALLLAGLLVAVRGRAPAAETSFADTWKVEILEPQAEITPFLVRLKEQGGKLEGEVLSSPLLGKATISRLRQADGGGLRLTIDAGGRSFAFVVRPPRGEATPKKLFGSVAVSGQHQYAVLERTDAKEIARNQAFVQNPAARDLVTALRKQGKERVAAYKELADKSGDSVSLATAARNALLQSLVGIDAPEAELRSAAQQLVKGVPAEYGPEMKTHAELDASRALIAKAPGLALDYARQVEKALPKDAPPAEQAAVLKVLVAALHKDGKKGEELQNATARLDKVNAELDEEFKKTAIPFQVKPYAGKAKSDRLVLVELFTGSQCPPCVAADVAFDAAVETYKAGEVAFLEYHEHIPGPDPMTNKDSEARAKYYGIQGTPTAYADGKETEALGGPKQTVEQMGQKFGGEASYEKLTGKINDELGSKPEARMELTARLDGDTLTIHAAASDVKKEAKDVHLRLALVEEVVRYPGGNGQRLHHHVVRDMPGGAKGTAVENGSAKVETKVDLGKLRKALADSLADYEKAGNRFSDDSRPLDLKHLRVVAFVQSDDTKAVLQAVQVELGHGK
jgi:thiol-disulfide isomerase/thioredoxin